MLKKKKEDFSKGGKRYIAAATTDTAAAEALSANKGLRDDLDEQDENDVGKKTRRISHACLVVKRRDRRGLLSSYRAEEEVGVPGPDDRERAERRRPHRRGDKGGSRHHHVRGPRHDGSWKQLLPVADGHSPGHSGESVGKPCCYRAQRVA